MATVIRRGEIRWFRFERPDKRRPVLVLGRDDALPLWTQVPGMPLSCRNCSNIFPSRGNGSNSLATLEAEQPARMMPAAVPTKLMVERPRIRVPPLPARTAH